MSDTKMAPATGSSARRSTRASRPATAPAAGTAGAKVILKVLAADGSTVRRFHLGPGEHVVGSAAGSAVPLDDGRVSRRHASLEVLADGGVVLTDLGSRNGTFLHGRRVERTALNGVAVLAFGPVHAVLKPADAAGAQVLLGKAADEPNEGGGPGRATPRAGQPRATDEAVVAEEHATSYGFYPLGRLAESLRELLPPMLAGETSVEATAGALAARLLVLLPVGRVELLRARPDGTEAVVAAASIGGRLPRDLVTRVLDGPAGWRLMLRAAELEPLLPADAMLLLALDLLAQREQRHEPGLPPRPSPANVPSGMARRGAAPPPPEGLGPEMARIYRQAAKVARGGVPMLILGESGSGKEVLARWVHARSRRAASPFLAVNCAALPRDLLEAEIFGIERGVATGVEARAGILERASGGTVFLDEIGDMPPELQAKLLRVLENTSLYRVGGRNPVAVDVRFLAATNRDLVSLVEAGSFRRDLYHRLAAFEAVLPPLRRRRDEIPSLAARFFRRETERESVASPGITRAAVGALVRYPWPGNVRELENEIARAVLLLEAGEPLDLAHLSQRLRASGAPKADSLTLEEAVQRAEREAFAVARAASRDDPARAMELLGVSRTTYYRKLKELEGGD